MELLQYLEKFKINLNDNIKLKPVLKNWNINVILRILDKNTQLTLIIIQGNLEEIFNYEIEGSKNFYLEATYDIFLDIFKGKINPTEAVLDGDLISFGNSDDEEKLDGIALIIWGI